MGIIIGNKRKCLGRKKQGSMQAGSPHQHGGARRHDTRRRRRGSGRERVALAPPRRHLDLEPGVVRLPVLDALQEVAVRVGRDVLVAEDLQGPELEAEVLEVGPIGGNLVFSMWGVRRLRLLCYGESTYSVET